MRNVPAGIQIIPSFVEQSSTAPSSLNVVAGTSAVISSVTSQSIAKKSDLGREPINLPARFFRKLIVTHDVIPFLVMHLGLLWCRSARHNARPKR